MPTQQTPRSYDPWTWGLAPTDATGTTVGPYGHVSQVSDASNQHLAAGFGLMHGQNGDLISANARLGVMGSGPNAMRVGADANAQLADGKAQTNYVMRDFLGIEDSPFDFGAGVNGRVFGANAELSLGNDGFSVGAEADAIDVGLSLGGFNAEDSWADSQAKVGVGYGVGAGYRGHWSDEDNDGVREIGMGGDIEVGPGLSVDFKTEALGHVWNAVTGLFSGAE